MAYVALEKGHPFTAEQEADRIRWAKRFITRLEGVGQGLGYGIFHGGSLIRDIDVVAVPWSTIAVDAEDGDGLITGLVHSMLLYWKPCGRTVFGHSVHRLWARGHEDHMIDLKIILPAAHPKDSPP